MRSIQNSPSHSLFATTNANQLSSTNEELFFDDLSLYGDLGNVAIDLSGVSFENILQQDLDHILEDEDAGTNPFLDVGDALSIASRASISVASQASLSSIMGHARRSHKKGSILRHVVLKNVSAQLLTGFSRIGPPSAIAVSAWLAVGSNSGFTYVFDGGQNLRWCLGSGTGKDIESFGAVSALTFNHDCTRLLCGHVRGQIVMYDVSNGKLLRIIEDAHQEEAAVINIKFTGNPTVAIFSDISGSVYEINFTRTLGVRGYDSSCLYGGGKGPAVAVEPLNQLSPKNPTQFETIVMALATLDKVMIVQLRPQRKVVYNQQIVGESLCLSLLSWQYLAVQTGDSNVIEPVLACAKGTSVLFVQLSEGRNNNPRCIPLISIALPYTISSMGWIDARTLVTFDTKERLHLIDVKQQEEIEDLDLSSVGVVYSSGNFKGLATGIQVNKDVACSGEYACYQSVIISCGQVFLLGTRNVHAVLLRTWRERIAFLVKNKRHVEALSFGNQLQEDKAKAVFGLRSGPDKKKVVKEKMREVIDDFVLTCVNPFLDDEIGLRLSCCEHIPGFVANCVKLDLASYVCDALYSRISNSPFAKAVFLESLETLILDDQLVFVDPVIAKDFVDHYESRGKLKALESCFLHLDISCLDFNQVIGICIKKSLHTALLYLHNKALDDYVGPLQDLFGVLLKLLDSQDDHCKPITELGNTIFVYTSCCMGGRSYPYGMLPDEKASRVAHEVLAFLTTLHSKRAVDSEQSYPYLRALLKVNTREFLNVLTMAFEESDLQDELGNRQRQRIVDILIQIMVQSDGFNTAQIGSLFTFIARQLAIPPLYLDRQLMLEVVEFITQPGSGERHEERQQALIELLQVPTVNIGQSVGADKLLAMAERAGFYRVCEDLYRASDLYDDVFRCLVREGGRRHLALPYMKSVLAQTNSHWSKKMKEALTDNLAPLLEFHLADLVDFLMKCEQSLTCDVLKYLSDDLEKRYQFMGRLLEARSDVSSAGSAYSGLSALFTKEFYLEHVQLMSQFEKSKLMKYVGSCPEDILGPELLLICSSCESKASEAVVLERLGETEKAFEKRLESFKDALRKALNTEDDSIIPWSQCEEEASYVVRFCERNSQQQFWLDLLDSLIDARGLSHQSRDLANLSQYVLSSVQGYVPPAAILQRVLNNSKGAKGTWADVKQLTLGMLESYNYETTLYDIGTRLFRSDTHRQLIGLKRRSTEAAVVVRPTCSDCAKVVIGTSSDLTVFRCGHIFHTTCISSSYNTEPCCRLCETCIMDASETPHVISIKAVKPKSDEGDEYCINRADEMSLYLQPVKRVA